LAGDGCKEELEQTYMKIAKMEERDVQKDSVIHFLKEKDLNNQNIIGYKDGQIGQLRQLSKNLEDELETRNNSLKWIKVFREFYNFMWTQRGYWEPRLKNA